MSLVSFTDLNPFDPSSSYIVTNEEQFIFNKLLGDAKFQRAACIASGGEFTLLVLKHRTEEIIAVDHSYKSLAGFLGKLILLRHFGGKKLSHLLIHRDYAPIHAIIKEKWPNVPAIFQARYKPFSNSYDCDQLRKVWVSESTSRLTSKDLNKICLLHGDLEELVNCGMFDLLYLSNALEHMNREGRTPDLTKICSVLKPGGLLLLTDSYGNNYSKNNSNFIKLASVRGIYSAWYYQVYKKN